MGTRSGTARPITLYGEAVLHRPCDPVTSFDENLAELVADMFASMYAANGVGLAANQIGVPLRAFVYDCTDAAGTRHVGHVVNPVLQPAWALAGMVSDEEGCLSIPGPHAELARPGLATVTGFDSSATAITVSGTGTLARCLQHESEHLDGIVYVDHLDPARRREVLAAAGLGQESH